MLEQMQALGWTPLSISGEIRIPRLSVLPTLFVFEPGKPARSSGFKSKSFSPHGLPVFGLPPKHERAPITPGNSLVAAGSQVIHNHVVSVSAADIKAIAALPVEFFHSLGNLLDHPSALVQAAIDFYLHRNKEGRILSGAEKGLAAIGTGSGAAMLQTIKEFARHFISDKSHEIRGEIRNEALKLLLGDTPDEATEGLMNAVQACLTAAAVAATIKEAQDFQNKTHYLRALNHPAGKHFLLNLESTIERKTVSIAGTPATVLRPVSHTEFGAFVGAGLGGALRLKGATPRSGVSGSTRVVGVRVGVDLQAFIYWWASK